MDQWKKVLEKLVGRFFLQITECVSGYGLPWAVDSRRFKQIMAEGSLSLMSWEVPGLPLGGRLL